MLVQHQYPVEKGVQTSHYGPRQGIYQPMESFKSSNWRTQYLVLNQGYQHKASKRISMPPNSFPARSLVKRPPISTCTFLPLSEPYPSKIKSSLHKTADPAPSLRKTSSISARPRYFTYAWKSCPRPRTPTQSSLCLTSAAAEMYHHPKTRSTPQLPQHRGDRIRTFPYLDPLNSQDQRFTSRLADFAKLECETVKQEALGHWTSQTLAAENASTSTSSVPRSTSSTKLRSTPTPTGTPKVAITNTHKVGGVTKRIPREARAKSAKTKSELESEAKRKTRRRHRHKGSAKAAQRISLVNQEACPAPPTESTQSLFDLQTSASPSEDDMQCLSLGSLSLEEEKGENEAATKGTELMSSPSSSYFKARSKNSQTRRTHHKKTKSKVKHD